jgi:hypothetical protein
MIDFYKKLYRNGMPHDVSIDTENKVLGLCVGKLIEEGKVDPSMFKKQ